MGDVVSHRTRTLGKLLGSLSEQIEQSAMLWEYQEQGYTSYRVNAAGESCETCQSMNGRAFDITQTTIGEALPPFHPNCDCTIEILDSRENVVQSHEITAQEEQSWGKYLDSSLKQLILGNYTDDVTLVGTILQVLAGVVGVDLPMDVRDFVYDVTNFEFTREHIAQTLLDAVAILPVVGGLKHVDEAADVLKAGAKSADEIADAVKAVENTNPFADRPKYIHIGNQGKHIIGYHNFDDKRGIVTIPLETIEMLIKKYSGTGRYINKDKEIVDFGIIIGKYVVEETGEAFDTTVGTIHYSIKKGAHIVPAKPKDWKD